MKRITISYKLYSEIDSLRNNPKLIKDRGFTKSNNDFILELIQDRMIMLMDALEITSEDLDQ